MQVVFVQAHLMWLVGPMAQTVGTQPRSRASRERPAPGPGDAPLALETLALCVANYLGISLVDFASIRIITDDLDRLVEFYEHVAGVSAERQREPLHASERGGNRTVQRSVRTTTQVRYGVDSFRCSTRRA